ncbi:MAG: YjbH domain-containing protein [Armatimonadota bacterium]
MLKVFACTALVLLLCGACCAEPESFQITTISWHGLSGLYVVPTARTLGHGRFAMGYSESRHIEFLGNGRFLDRQVRSTLNYGINDQIEISGNYVRDLITTGDGFSPVLSNQSFNTWGFKWRFLDETKRRPAVAFAVRDIFGNMQDIDPLQNVENGTKYFLLATKRLIYREETGRFIDGTLGVTKDEQKVAALFGMELALSPNISYIAEGMWDSPYMNFRGIYLQPQNKGVGNQPGRFIFDSGFRIYPDVLPGLVIDLGFVADSQPEYSWGVSYVAGL